MEERATIKGPFSALDGHNARRFQTDIARSAVERHPEGPA